jgi:hypothetical protein
MFERTSSKAPLQANPCQNIVEDITQHMASLPSPKSSNTKRTYDTGVFELIDHEAT